MKICHKFVKPLRGPKELVRKSIINCTSTEHRNHGQCIEADHVEGGFLRKLERDKA
jgi:hypothetical protein